MIRGKIDQHDLNTWQNWGLHRFPEKKRRWWHYLLGPGIFFLPVIVSELVGFDFHMQTYLVTVALWSFCMAFLLFYKFVSRRERNKSMQPYDFSVDRSNVTVSFRGSDSQFEVSARSLAVIRLPENLLIFRDGTPISISPRNENLEDGKTIGDIEKLILGD